MGLAAAGRISRRGMARHGWVVGDGPCVVGWARVGGMASIPCHATHPAASEHEPRPDQSWVVTEPWSHGAWEQRPAGLHHMRGEVDATGEWT